LGEERSPDILTKKELVNIDEIFIDVAANHDLDELLDVQYVLVNEEEHEVCLYGDSLEDMKQEILSVLKDYDETDQLLLFDLKAKKRLKFEVIENKSVEVEGDSVMRLVRFFAETKVPANQIYEQGRELYWKPNPAIKGLPKDIKLDECF
jgi:hypothetical protein